MSLVVLLAATIAAKRCICSYLHAPVCSTLGHTFDNNCTRICAHEDFAYNGVCHYKTFSAVALLAAMLIYVDARDCNCPQVYAPVCSKSNRTYSNDCERGCSGDALAHGGTCSGEGRTDMR